MQSLLPRTEQAIAGERALVKSQLALALRAVGRRAAHYEVQLGSLQRVLTELDPRRVLERGYALIRGVIDVGSVIEIEKSDILIKAEVQNVSKK